MSRYLLPLVFLLLSASVAPASKVTINADAVLEVEEPAGGNPAGGSARKIFLIGFIMPPQPEAKTPAGKNGIDELADAGATFLRTGIIGPQSKWDDAAFAREQKWQDAAARNGMHCLIGLRYAGSVQDDKPENEAALRRVIETFKNHPGMGAYYGIDEPDWNEHPVEPMERAYNIIKELDPHHPVWICQAPRGSIASMKRYDHCGDATGGDIYPISYPPGIHVPATAAGVPAQLAGNSDLSLAGDFTRMMVEVATADVEISNVKLEAPNKLQTTDHKLQIQKPVWMCLPIAWSGMHKPGKTLRFPTFFEQRFMTYHAIINGARGIIYFGGQIGHTLPVADRPYGWNWTHWKRVLRPVVEEIGTNSPLYPALVAPSSKMPVTSPAAGIEFCVRETDDAVFVIACRRDRQTAPVTFAGLPLPDQVTELLFESPREVQLKDGAFSDWFAPFEVHVYRFRKGGNAQ